MSALSDWSEQEEFQRAFDGVPPEDSSANASTSSKLTKTVHSEQEASVSLHCQLNVSASSQFYFSAVHASAPTNSYPLSHLNDILERLTKLSLRDSGDRYIFQSPDENKIEVLQTKKGDKHKLAVSYISFARAHSEGSKDDLSHNEEWHVPVPGVMAMRILRPLDTAVSGTGMSLLEELFWDGRSLHFDQQARPVRPKSPWAPITKYTDKTVIIFSAVLCGNDPFDTGQNSVAATTTSTPSTSDGEKEYVLYLDNPSNKAERSRIILSRSRRWKASICDTRPKSVNTIDFYWVKQYNHPRPQWTLPVDRGGGRKAYISINFQGQRSIDLESENDMYISSDHVRAMEGTVTIDLSSIAIRAHGYNMNGYGDGA